MYVCLCLLLLHSSNKIRIPYNQWMLRALSLPIFKITCLSKIKLKKMRKIERFVDGITTMSILPLAWHAEELLPSFDNHFATIKITSTKALSFSLYSAFFCTCYGAGGRWRGRRSFKAILITISIHVFIDNWSLIYSLFAFTAVHLISRYSTREAVKYEWQTVLRCQFNFSYEFPQIISAQHEMPFASFTHTHTIYAREYSNWMNWDVWMQNYISRLKKFHHHCRRWCWENKRKMQI